MVDRRRLFERVPNRLQPLVAGVYRTLFPHHYVPLMYDHPPHPGEETINPARLESVPDTLPKRHYQHLELVGDRVELIEHFPRHARGAEIGVAQGDFASRIYERTDPDSLYLIDIWRNPADEAIVRERFQDAIADGSVHLVRDESTAALSEFEDGYFDFVYLDTNHKFNQTLAELRAAEDKVATDGIIAGHDFTVGNEPSRQMYGVIPAVFVFCVEHDWELRYLTLQADGHDSFVLGRL